MKREVLKIISLGLASLSFVICLLLWGEISGFKKGFLAAYHVENADNTIKIATSGPNFFEFVIGKYALIALCFYIYLVGKLIKEENSSQFLCILSLVVSIILYLLLLQFKYGIDDSAVLLYREWLTTSIKFDWFCFFTAVGLLIIQIASLATNYFKRKSNSISI